jgi:[ribosomal protein S5]-alanine N-acetyltransferase
MAEYDEFFLRSRRLGWRHWRPGDLDLALRLWGDERVTRLIVAGGRLTPEQVRRKLDAEMAMQREHGVQYWPVFLLEDGGFAGCCGLRPYKPHEGILEIGCHFCADCWGHGYATEGIRTMMAYAFDELSVSGLFAGHHPDNAVSGHLLKKLGFTYTHDEYYEPTGLKHPSYLFEYSVT